MIISVISEKGGVGKTTTAVNTARCLAGKGKKVLVIDLDQQGNASKALGYTHDGKLTSAEIIYNTIAGIDMDCSEAVRRSESGVDYIPASPMLTGITTFIANDSDSSYVVKRVLCKEFFNSYDYIIFDCRTLLDLLAANALNASTHVIIPVESGLYSYMGLHKMIDKVKSINNSTNRHLKVLGILFNKLQRTVVAQEIIEDVKARYGDFVFETTIPFCPAQAEQAVLEDRLSSNKSSLGKAFMSVADEIIKRAGNVD